MSQAILHVWPLQGGIMWFYDSYDILHVIQVPTVYHTYMWLSFMHLIQGLKEDYRLAQGYVVARPELEPGLLGAEAHTLSTLLLASH